MTQRTWIGSSLLCALLLAGCRDPSTKPVVDPPAGEIPTENCPPLCTPLPGDAINRVAQPNPIPAENARPGNPDWRSGSPANAGEIELYASTESAEAGNTVAVKVSTQLAGDFQVNAKVYRIGDYGGAGARLVWSGGPYTIRRQAACPRTDATGLVECNWSDTFSFTVGNDWVSGVYVVKVQRADGTTLKRFTPLIVRDHRAAELLFQPAVATYQAYNTYGGQSLYADASGLMPNGRSYEVSFNRPYRDDEGVGNKLFRYELPFVQWLEKEGYDVTYATNLDFLRYKDLLNGIGAFVHVGHDEYWPTEERAQVDLALGSGKTSLAYFGGNGAYWRIRAREGADGAKLRTVICYKNELDKDPQPGSTVRFRDEPNEHSEQRLFGSMYDGWQLIPFPLTVKDQGHWLFEGTGLTNGAQLHGLLGYEVDRVWEGMPGTPATNQPFESPFVTAEGVPNLSQVVERTLSNGRLVFSAGSIYWPLAFVRGSEEYDERVHRMTQNVLERALSHLRPVRNLPPAGSVRQTQPAPRATWVAVVEAFAGEVGRGGFRDGPAEQALFAGPTGIAADRDGRVYVADTRNNRVRMVDVDAARTVYTIAGNGQPGLRDGDGANAMLRWPTGLAVGPDGAVYVADSDNHAIRRLVRTGGGWGAASWTVETWAGSPLRQQGYANGVGTVARFRRPTHLAVDATGNLYVADQAGNRIRRIDAATREVTLVAGNGLTGYRDSGDGASAMFNNPSAVVVNPDGSLYVFDGGNQRVRLISGVPARSVSTIAGSDRPLGFSDGDGTQARFRAQMGMVRDDFLTGNTLYLTDTGNFRLRKLIVGADRASTQVWTIAGSGKGGTDLGSGDVADLVAPAGVVQLPSARLVVSDTYNNVLRIITR